MGIRLDGDGNLFAKTDTISKTTGTTPTTAITDSTRAAKGLQKFFEKNNYNNNKSGEKPAVNPEFDVLETIIINNPKLTKTQQKAKKQEFRNTHKAYQMQHNGMNYNQAVAEYNRIRKIYSNYLAAHEHGSANRSMIYLSDSKIESILAKEGKAEELENFRKAIEAMKVLAEKIKEKTGNYPTEHELQQLYFKLPNG